MDDQKVMTVTIPLEEYMSLIREAEFNRMILDRFLDWEMRLHDCENRLNGIECRLPRPM